MVSLSSIFYATLAAAVVSAQHPIDEYKAQDRYVSIASRQLVRAFTDAKSPNVNAAQASSEAQHFVTALLDYPGFKKIIQQAEIQLGNENENVDTYAVASTYLASVSKAYDEFSRGPSFAPYTSYFKAHITDFDVQKGIRNARSTANEYYPLVSEPVKSFFADPRGKALGTSAANLARHFVSDVGLGKYASHIPSGPPMDPVEAPVPEDAVYTTIYATVSAPSDDEDEGGDCGYSPLSTSEIAPAPTPVAPIPVTVTVTKSPEYVTSAITDTYSDYCYTY
ncbi:hypothetical protein AWJ20_4126 [Sugiyamaella lignohabitans]|uniref:Uncharacterized protein n=1 Tax=Sugiyamaella lignohabitans TaxID=796027 RepID=A0A167C7N1_9ASCO|nr:uncharacterized protein AWJ20_4126 [Sugiyamaella lignohabitans]ANB11322.1 hypothetical protein AWJ20_4126 [Sugiyamaella lignohabitans]